jgi:hypothetical protein
MSRMPEPLIAKNRHNTQVYQRLIELHRDAVN